MNTEYPNTKAHSIQVTKILFTLSQFTDVTFVCNKFTVEESSLYGAIKEQYGFNLENVKFIPLPKSKLKGLSFPFTITKLLSNFPKNSVVYTRSYSIAKRLARTKFIHNRLVILESHKKNGYNKEDTVNNSIYSEQRKSFELNNKDKKTLQRIYSCVDGVVFTSLDSKKIVEKDLGIQNTAYIWHPLRPHPSTKDPERTAVYSGSLAQDKLIDLLLDALATSRCGVVVDLIGGAPKDVERIKLGAQKRGITDNLRFLDRVPYRTLPAILSNYKFGLSLMEGLKVADYVECGLVPIIPRLPMYTEIFNEDSAVFFEPDDKRHLGQILAHLEDSRTSHVSSHDILDAYSLKATADKIFSLIEKCSNA
jgi:glycosyltransferase involved in cell wall biosynthesis